MLQFLGPNFWPAPISRGKNFGGVFFDVFSKSEQESEKILALGTSLAEIPN